jgi:hypothetical protein
MNKWLLLISFLLLFFNTSKGQFPPIGIIDFYGLRSVSEKDVLSVLKIKKGDDAIETLKSIEENKKLLKSLPNVEDASISLICCDDFDHKSMIFVGIREKGVPVLSFRSAPQDKIRLPENIVKAGEDFQKAFLKAIENQDFSEDDSQGHALFGNKDVRSIQERFIVLAAQNLKILRRVLHHSSDARQRALAAQIIAYFKDKKAIVGDLVFGMSDPDSSVRNDSMRGLIIIAKYAQANPRLSIKIPMTVFVRMLNSLEWTDRNKSVGALHELTKKRDATLLVALKKESLISLTEMARWRNPNHAESAFYILGRIGKFSEKEIQAKWKSENRENEIQTFLEKINAQPD